MLYILGITGSIGCGKSTITRLLGTRGARTLDADQLARAALAPGSPLLSQVADRFGADLLATDTPTPTLNRTLLAERVFADPTRLRQLETLIHPYVFQQMAATLNEWATTPPPHPITIAALEIPLLFETHSAHLCDGILVVACGEEQNTRLAQRPNIPATLRQQIIAQQLPESLKCQQAHWILDNRHDPATLPARLDPIWQELHTRPPPTNPAWPTQWHPWLQP
ncbi:MAG: dephospho-CoA kinase [Magnetococcales bacterium]|nr:dephospho-CoA kinase [Magnetococcales bacterium]